MPQVRVAHATDETSLRELLFLQRLSKAAASTIEPDALLELIIRETTGAMQVEVCSLYLYDPATEEVTELEKLLTDAGREFEFHTYEGAGHAFFNTDRPSYRPEAAVDGWSKIWDFFGRNLH